MSDKPPASRSRLQELLAIPERERSDEQWDELHELELQNAPAMRSAPPNRNPQRLESLPSSGPLNPNPAGKKRGRQRFRHGQQQQKKNRPPR